MKMENSLISNFNNQLSKQNDKTKILTSIILQLEKDTGLDYTAVKIPEDLSNFIIFLKKDIANHLKKIASQNQTNFMNIIYRVDISQYHLKKLKMDKQYYENLAELVLNRLFQKTITKIYFK